CTRRRSRTPGQVTGTALPGSLLDELDDPSAVGIRLAADPTLGDGGTPQELAPDVVVGARRDLEQSEIDAIHLERVARRAIPLRAQRQNDLATDDIVGVAVGAGADHLQRWAVLVSVVGPPPSRNRVRAPALVDQATEVACGVTAVATLLLDGVAPEVVG